MRGLPPYALLVPICPTPAALEDAILEKLRLGCRLPTLRRRLAHVLRDAARIPVRTCDDRTLVINGWLSLSGLRVGPTHRQLLGIAPTLSYLLASLSSGALHPQPLHHSPCTTLDGFARLGTVLIPGAPAIPQVAAHLFWSLLWFIRDKAHSRIAARLVLALWPRSSPELRRRLRVDAHTLVPILRLLLETRGERCTRVLLAGTLGMGIQTLSRVVLWAVLTPISDRSIQYLATHHMFSDPRRVADSLKTVSSLVRQTWSNALPGLYDPQIDPSHLLYLNILVGRYPDSDGSARGEVASRTAPLPPQLARGRGGWSQSTYDSVLADQLERVASAWPSRGPLCGLTLDEAVPLLLPQATQGASAAAGFSVDIDGERTRTRRSTKGVLLARVAPKDLRDALASERRMRATALAKLESGYRNRLLIPGSDRTWLLSAFASLAGENQWCSRARGACLREGPHAELRRHLTIVSALKQGTPIVCSDYADFNSLHVYPTGIGRFWRALARRCRLGCQKGDAQELAADCFEWLADALADARVLDGAGHSHKFDHGLWTGWRFTTLVNTAMNLAYDGVIRHNLGEHSFQSAWYYGLGDDSAMAAPSLLAGARYLAALKNTGYDAQATKQLLSTSRAEFLRVIYTKTSMHGSLIRAISNAVSSDLQSSEFLPSIARAPSLLATVHMWMRRGASKNAQRVFWALASEMCGSIDPTTLRHHPAPIADVAALVGLRPLGPLRSSEYIIQPPKLTVAEPCAYEPLGAERGAQYSRGWQLSELSTALRKVARLRLRSKERIPLLHQVAERYWSALPGQKRHHPKGMADRLLLALGLRGLPPGVRIPTLGAELSKPALTKTMSCESGDTTLPTDDFALAHRYGYHTREAFTTTLQHAIASALGPFRSDRAVRDYLADTAHSLLDVCRPYLARTSRGFRIRALTSEALTTLLAKGAMWRPPGQGLLSPGLRALTYAAWTAALERRFLRRSFPHGQSPSGMLCASRECYAKALAQLEADGALQLLSKM